VLVRRWFPCRARTTMDSNAVLILCTTPVTADPVATSAGGAIASMESVCDRVRYLRRMMSARGRCVFLLILTTFAVGCGAGWEAGQRVGDAEYPPNAEAPRWEQHCGRVTDSTLDARELNALLARRGREGWELISAQLLAPSDTVFYCFKRLAPKTPAAP